MTKHYAHNLKARFLSTAAIALTFSVCGGTAYGVQEAVDDKFSLEEIVVTARKKKENIQEAPLSVSAFTKNMLEAANIKSLDEVAKFTPGFSFDDEFGRSASNRPVIRGQSTILGASGVSTFIDGVLIGGSSLDYDLGDVERIEIIKGPQSALYGRNTYSGAINIITKSPTDEVSGNLKVEKAGFDQWDIGGSIRGPISDTVSGSLTGRYYSRGGPFLNTFDGTDVGQQESKSLSGVLYFKPNDDLDIRARVRWSQLDDDQPRLFRTEPEDNNCFFDNGGAYLGNGRYFCGELTEQPIAIDDVRLLDQKGFDKNTTWDTSLKIDYKLSENWDLSFINGYNSSSSSGQGDFGYSAESLSPFSVYIGPVFPLFGPYFFHAFVTAGPVADFAAAFEGESSDYSSELRLSYTGEKWHGMLGGYYYSSDSTNQGARSVPSGFASIVEEAYNENITRMTAQCAAHAGDAFAPCFSVPGFDSILNFGDELEDLQFFADDTLLKTERKNVAIFGTASFDLTEDFTLTAEGRYASEKVTSRTDRASVIYDYLGTQTGTDSSPRTVRSATFNDFNPRFTASYKASETVNFYAVAARGNKPGGFNSTLVEELGISEFDEESVWSFEVGIKSTFLDRRLIFNVAAFRNTIDGYQLTESVVIPSTNTTTTVTTNTGRVRIKGVEIEMVFAPEAIPGLVFNANYALSDSEILEGTDINEGKLLDVQDDGRLNCSLGTADPAEPDCDTTGDNTKPGSIVGRQLPRQAKHMLNLGLNYEKTISSDWKMVMNANLSYESKKFVQVHNLAWVGASTLVNASLGFENESMRIVAWVKNLTKEDAVVSASRFIDESASFQRAFMANPRLGRQFGVTGTFKF